MKKNFSGRKLLSKIFLIVLISSCSILSKNMFRQGEIFFNGGRHLSESWRDKIQMKRFSWFQELSLSFDFVDQVLHFHIGRFASVRVYVLFFWSVVGSFLMRF